MSDLNLQRLRRWAMQEALNRSANIKEAADLLGLERSALSRDSRKYGLSRPWDDGPQRNKFRGVVPEDSPEHTNPEAWKLTMLEHFRDLHIKNDQLEQRNVLLQAKLDEAMARIAKTQQQEMRAVG